MKNTVIKRIECRTVFDSRGVETLEVDVYTEGGGFGRAAAPFGAPGSRGEFEAPDYASGGVIAALKLAENELVPRLKGQDAAEWEKTDAMLKSIDGTANFSRLGGNTSTVFSVACAKAAAAAMGEPLFKLLNPKGGYWLPFPLGNIIGGGAHSLGPAPDMQEHLVVPVGATDIKQAIEINLKVHEAAGSILEKRHVSFVGGTDDENAWVADLNDVEAFEVLEEAAAEVTAATGVEIRLGFDLAADRLWDPEKNVYRYFREKTTRTTAEQLDYLTNLAHRFKFIYLEDGFHSNDYESFAKLNEKVGRYGMVCADDVYASDPDRTKVGIGLKAAKAMIIKTNQIGTLSGALTTTRLAQANEMAIVISHRSGETPDDSIAHQAVAWNGLMLKTGVKGGERLAKLNELIRLKGRYPELKMAGWPGLEDY
jgi:enolase